MSKEAELTKAEETIRREQQRIQEMKVLYMLTYTCTCTLGRVLGISFISSSPNNNVHSLSASWIRLETPSFLRELKRDPLDSMYLNITCVFQTCVQGVTELQQQLQSSEREKLMLRQQLVRKEAEQTKAEETIRREQQQMRQLVHTCMHVWRLP